MIQSPCVKICVMNPQAGICSGCGRTLAEIARWGGMSDAERARIMAELPSRPGKHSGATANADSLKL